MVKFRKQNTASTTGLLVGLILGFLIGLGMFKQTPKSERSAVFPYLIGIGVILITIAGYKIGAVNDDQNFRDEYLGIKHIKTSYLKDEINWSIESTWLEHDGKENKLVTTIVDDELITIFNHLIVMNHGYTSGSKSAHKLHEETKNDLIQRLKDSFEV